MGSFVIIDVSFEVGETLFLAVTLAYSLDAMEFGLLS